ncbi:unnamed protein product [Dicrocoelium dendriticum]|nr:unnamed protein product [Dicrocoelium dendriticum]
MINLYSSMLAQQNWRDFFSDGLHFSRKGSEFLANIFISMFSEILVDCPLRQTTDSGVEVLCRLRGGLQTDRRPMPDSNDQSVLLDASPTKLARLLQRWSSLFS